MEIKLGGVEVKNPTHTSKAMSIMLWGASGVGKTTLAMTAPGKKLLVQFDNKGDQSISHRDDYVIADLSLSKYDIIGQCKGTDNPLFLDNLLKQDPSIETIIVDSLTSFGELAMEYAVKNTSAKTPLTIEAPGQLGWGIQASIVFQFMTSMIRVASRHDKHIIFIAHEKDIDKEDNPLQSTVSVTGGLKQALPAKLSEVWYLADETKGKAIHIRGSQSRKPMKTRMFETAGLPKFMWKFDPEELKGEGIAEWHKKWSETGKKIPLPA